MPKYIKNFKYSQRNKETEDALKRQASIETKYKQRNEVFKNRNLKRRLDEHEEEDLAESENVYEKLVSSLQSSGKAGAIDSSDGEDEESETGEEEMEEEEQDSLDEEISEDEMKDNSDEGSLSNDEDIDDPSFSVKPEEMRQKKPKARLLDVENEDVDVDSDLELDPEEDLNEGDGYATHLSSNLSPNLLSNLQNLPSNLHKSTVAWPNLGKLFIEIPRSATVEKGAKTLLNDAEKFASEGQEPAKLNSKTVNLDQLNVKKKLQTNIFYSNRGNKDKFTEKDMTALQWELFPILNNYQDLYTPYRTFKNGEEVRFAYALHSMNHILKSRAEVIKNNSLINKKGAIGNDDLIRDQGLVRPKVLIVLPLKDAAYRVIKMMIDLYVPELNGRVINHKRFTDEFTGDDLHFSKTNPKPEDYEQIFSGNTDDNFRIGLSLTKKCLKLYSDFYSADIIVASPLGLRMIIGAPGDEKRDYDFLASIEVLVLDQLDVMYAQNWDHLLHVLDHLHLQPKSRENTDFSRVRTWCLNGLSKFYRQSLIFAGHDLPEFRSIFNNRCQNYRGKLRASNTIAKGTIRHCAVQVPQTFHRIDASSIEGSFDDRFAYFTNVIVPQFNSATMAHCLIYIPSYFDFVRIRNYFKKEIDKSSVQICEYTKDSKTARARDMFFHSGAHFLLYTERAHFFCRPRIKGIRHLIFYQPPSIPHFYPEMVNLMQEAYQNPRDGLEHNMTVTVLYTKYDAMQLAAIVSSKNCAELMRPDKKTHLFVTEK